MPSLARASRSLAKAGPVSGAKAKARPKPRPKAEWAFASASSDNGAKDDAHDGAMEAAGAQAKMEVSKPGDALEREADRVADHVTRAPAAATKPASDHDRDDKHAGRGHVMRKADGAATLAVQRACDSCAAEDEHSKKVHRKAQDAAEIARAEKRGVEEDRPSIQHTAQRMAADDDRDHKMVHRQATDDERKMVHRRATDDERKMVHRQATDDERKVAHRDAADQAQEGDEGHDGGAGAAFEERLRFAQLGGGAPLPGPLAALMESRFGTSFRRVRVHVGENGAELAQSVRARAFTVGRHIFFAPGRFQPQTEQGRRLVAHELTHVMQQRGGLHSVQREVEAGARREDGGVVKEERDPDAEDVAAVAGALDPLLRIFNLRDDETPPLVFRIIKEMLGEAMRVLPKARKLLPFVDPLRSKDRTVRRTLRSPSHELRLESTLVGQGPKRDTEWQLTFLDGTRAPAKGGQAAGGTDEDALNVAGNRPPAAPQPGADVSQAAAVNATQGAAAPASTAPAAASAAPAAAPAPAPAGAVPIPAPAAAGGSETAAAAPAAGAAPAAAALPAAAGGGVEPPVQSPPPEDSPEFKAVTERAKAAADKSDAHGGSDTLAANAKDAADVKPSETASEAQKNQVANMQAQPAPAFDKQAFINAVFKKLEDVTPKNLKEAKDFKPNNKIGEVTGPVGELTKTEADKSREPLAKATDAAPDTRAVKPREAPPLASEAVGERPADIDAAKAVPPPRPASAVEDVAKQGKATVDGKMAELGLPDPEKTLANSNEPQMIGALAAKQNVDQQTTAGPVAYRAEEAALLGGARNGVTGAAAQGLGAMFGSRAGHIKGVAQSQAKGKMTSEQKRQAAATEVNQIYETTRTKVTTRLGALEQTVGSLFKTESEKAAKTLAERIAAAEKRWEDVSFLDKAAQAVDSFLFSMPNELEQELRALRASFLDEMHALVEKIATIVADELNAAKKDVDDGRAQVAKILDGLGPDLAGFKAELKGQFDGKFNALDSDIHKTFDKLADDIGTKVKDSVAAADKALGEARERNKGFIDQAVAALGNTITTFLELKAKLEATFAAAKDAVLRVLADPMTFLSNLFAGIGQGLQSFGRNILKHLVNGVIQWLTGTLGQAGITLPDKFDAMGILSLFLQIVGLSIENVKARARVIWGDKVVDAIEKGIAGAEKALELFNVLRTEGVMGLVRLLKEKIIALKDQALDQIKQALAVEVVAAAIQNLLSLLTPASALVQAVIKIVNVVLYFIRNASKISDLVNAIVGGVNDVLNGNISAVAARVETALANAIPLVLDFMASLIGIGGRIVEAIKKGIAFIRKPVDEAIDFVLLGIKSFIKGLINSIMGFFGGKKKPDEKSPEHPPGSPEAIVEIAFNRMHEPISKDTPGSAIDAKEQQAAQIMNEFQAQLPQGRHLKITVDRSKADAEKEGKVHFTVSASPGRAGDATWTDKPFAPPLPATQVNGTGNVAQANPLTVKGLGTGAPTAGRPDGVLAQAQKAISAQALERREQRRLKALREGRPFKPTGGPTSRVYDRTHLVSAQLGGPFADWNIRPTTVKVNAKMRTQELKVLKKVKEVPKPDKIDPDTKKPQTNILKYVVTVGAPPPGKWGLRAVDSQPDKDQPNEMLKQVEGTLISSIEVVATELEQTAPGVFTDKGVVLSETIPHDLPETFIPTSEDAAEGEGEG